MNEVGSAISFDLTLLIAFGGLIVTIVGGAWARDRQITNMIHRNYEETMSAIKSGDDVLHERVSRVREDMNVGYVRREDLDGHLVRIERSIGDLRADMKDERKETHQRLDLLITALSKDK